MSEETDKAERIRARDARIAANKKVIKNRGQEQKARVKERNALRKAARAEAKAEAKAEAEVEAPPSEVVESNK